MISIKTIEKEFSCFRNLGRQHAFVCELFPITRINQDFLFAMKTKLFKILSNSWDSRYCVRPI